MRTDDLLRMVDKTLASLHTPSRTIYTTVEIEDLLLDLRNELEVYCAMDRRLEIIDAMLREFNP